MHVCQSLLILSFFSSSRRVFSFFLARSRWYSKPQRGRRIPYETEWHYHQIRIYQERRREGKKISFDTAMDESELRELSSRRMIEFVVRRVYRIVCFRHWHKGWLMNEKRICRSIFLTWLISMKDEEKCLENISFWWMRLCQSQMRREKLSTDSRADMAKKKEKPMMNVKTN